MLIDQTVRLCKSERLPGEATVAAVVLVAAGVSGTVHQLLLAQLDVDVVAEGQLRLDGGRRGEGPARESDTQRRLESAHFEIRFKQQTYQAPQVC